MRWQSGVHKSSCVVRNSMTGTATLLRILQNSLWLIASSTANRGEYLTVGIARIFSIAVIFGTTFGIARVADSAVTRCTVEKPGSNQNGHGITMMVMVMVMVLAMVVVMVMAMRMVVVMTMIGLINK